MKTAILIYCAMICAAAGQWATNGVWPSYAYPRQSRAQFADVYSAAVERCYAAGISIEGPRLYRYGYDNMTNLKARMKTAIPFYIVTNGQDGDLSYDIATNGLRHYTATGLLWDARMPTNWFDYTPWSNLSGVGPFTNANYAWGNGWTNEQTAAGGTNYPAGRTNWYTTDYGLMWATNIFPPLVWANPKLMCDLRIVANELSLPEDSYSWGDLYSLMISYSNEWWNYRVSINNVPSLEAYGIGTVSWAYWDTPAPTYGNLFLAVTTGEADIYPASTNRPDIKFNVDYYAQCGPYDFYYDIGRGWFDDPSGRVFNAFGEVRASEYWLRIDQEFDRSATNFFYTFGSTNFPAIMCDQPAYTNDRSLKGWNLIGSPYQELDSQFISILKFDGTNGFKYR